MVTNEDIEHFAFRSGLTEPSLRAIRPDYRRWKRHLADRGVHRIPTPLSTAREDELAINLLSQLILQVSRERKPAVEHTLRNLTATRPYKP